MEQPSGSLAIGLFWGVTLSIPLWLSLWGWLLLLYAHFSL